MPDLTQQGALVEAAQRLVDQVAKHPQGCQSGEMTKAWIALVEALMPWEPDLPRPQPAESKRACRGFAWIGQPMRYCDRCSLPAWEHEGVEELAPKALPFGGDEEGDWVIKPWTGLMAKAHEHWKSGGRVLVMPDPGTGGDKLRFEPADDGDEVAIP